MRSPAVLRRREPRYYRRDRAAASYFVLGGFCLIVALTKSHAAGDVVAGVVLIAVGLAIAWSNDKQQVTPDDAIVRDLHRVHVAAVLRAIEDTSPGTPHRPLDGDTLTRIGIAGVLNIYGVQPETLIFPTTETPA